MLRPVYTYRLRFRQWHRQNLYSCVSGEGPFDGQIGSGIHSGRQCDRHRDGNGQTDLKTKGECNVWIFSFIYCLWYLFVYAFARCERAFKTLMQMSGAVTNANVTSCELTSTICCYIVTMVTMRVSMATWSVTLLSLFIITVVVVLRFRLIRVKRVLVGFVWKSKSVRKWI